MELTKKTTARLGLLHFDESNYLKAISQSNHIAEKMNEAYSETVELCKSKRKTPPSIESFLDNPMLSTEIAIVEGVNVEGMELSNKRILEMQDVSLNFLSGTLSLKKKRPYNELKDIKGKIGYAVGFLEVTLKEAFTFRCETPNETYLHKKINRLYAFFNEMKNGLGKDFNGNPQGFSELTGNILYYDHIFQHEVLINVPEFRRIAALLEIPKKETE
jgi:hypothetical protein